MVYRSGLSGYRNKPLKFKFPNQTPRSIGFWRFTERLKKKTGLTSYRPLGKNQRFEKGFPV
jgi:hypothetical protein